MDIYAFLSEGTFWKVRAVLFGMEELAFFIFEVAVGEEPALDLLLLISGLLLILPVFP